jgi:hypothetical protein
MPRPFASPARAQCWYTFHSPFGRVGRIFSVVYLGAYGFAFGISRAPVHEVNPHLAVFGMTVCYPIVGLSVLFLVALPLSAILRALGIRLPKPDTSLKRFFTLEYSFARPLSSGTLAAAFLRSQLLGVLTTFRLWLPVALVAGLGWHVARFGSGRAVRDLIRVFGDLPGWQWLGIAVLLASAGVAVLWRLGTDLRVAAPQPGWIQQGIGIAVVFAMFTVNGLAAVCVSLLLDPATRAPAVRVFAWIGIGFLAAKVVFAFAAYRAARQADLFDGAAFRDFRRCWLAVAVPAVGSTAVLLPAQLAVPAWLALLWIMVLLPLGRFALITFSFEQTRHGESLARPLRGETRFLRLASASAEAQ